MPTSDKIQSAESESLEYYSSLGYSEADARVLLQIFEHRMFSVRETNDRKVRYLDWLDHMIRFNRDEVREWLSEVHSIDGNIMVNLNETLGYID